MSYYNEGIEPPHIVRENEIFCYCKEGLWLWLEDRKGTFYPLCFKESRGRFEEPSGKRWLYAEDVSAADYEINFRVWNRLPFDEITEEWRDFE